MTCSSLERPTIKSVGIIGTGTMGTALARACCLAGFQVHLKGVSDDQTIIALETLRLELEQNFSDDSPAANGYHSAVDHLRPATCYEDFSDCDIVVEAAVEDKAVKYEIFLGLGSVLPAGVVIASTTSSIAITHLAAKTSLPERFIGLHFIHPVTETQVVELVRGIATEDRTFELANLFAVQLGKTVIEAADFPGFIINRIMLPLINEAVYVLYEGVASVSDIDTALESGARHSMGPLKLADFIGLDTCLSLMQSLHEGLSDTKYRPCPLLVKYVEAGWLGRKTKRGFYDYRSDVATPTR
ncbi:3-hydroxyacyl-CoA dehydrogenase NAD-binding domain-containing protein [Aestuariivirga sp.]|uniref:3-hydroxyacyl-CoA dehydrogenase NAD-binding domain-containing protein n=1 Tax=Aestuariivirga sp. TaxID=2650926 RepID=UPI00391C9CE8